MSILAKEGVILQSALEAFQVESGIADLEEAHREMEKRVGRPLRVVDELPTGQAVIVCSKEPSATKTHERQCGGCGVAIFLRQAPSAGSLLLCTPCWYVMKEARGFA